MKQEFEMFRSEPNWSDWEKDNPKLAKQARDVRSRVLLAVGEGLENGGALLRGLLLAYVDMRHELTDPTSIVTPGVEASDVEALLNAHAQVRLESAFLMPSPTRVLRAGK